MRTDQSGGHRVYLFSIKSKFCLSPRHGPWCCNPAVHRRLPHLPPSLQPHNWGFFCSTGIMWVDGRWGWVEAGFVSMSISIPFSLLQPRPCTICSTQWAFYSPAGRPELPQDETRQADEPSTATPLCCTPAPNQQSIHLCCKCRWYLAMSSHDTANSKLIDVLLSAGANNRPQSLSLLWVAAEGFWTGNICFKIAIKKFNLLSSSYNSANTSQETPASSEEPAEKQTPKCLNPKGLYCSTSATLLQGSV